MTTQAPLVLIDQPDDGYCEEHGWVEAIVPIDEARTLLAPFCYAPDGDEPGAKPIGEPKTVWLTPQWGHEEDERWMSVEVPVDGEPGSARKFFEFDAQDTEVPA